MTILYITFIDFGEFKSGSSVRPQKMYDAFRQLGHEVKLLEGQQNRRAERKQKTAEILSWLDSHTPDICYVEPPAGPFFNAIDLKLLKKVRLLEVCQVVGGQGPEKMAADPHAQTGSEGI